MVSKQPDKKMKFWTKEEFDTFITCVDKPIYNFIFNLLFYTGIRCGELLALTGNDFDIANKTLSINKTFYVVNRKKVTAPPKTSKGERVISLPNFIIDLFNEYIPLIYDYSLDKRLFPITASTVRYQLCRYCKKANIKQIRIHDLRHSHASLLINLGFQPLIISERLGHEDIQTTFNIYGHLYPNSQSEIADKLDEIF